MQKPNAALAENARASSVHICIHCGVYPALRILGRHYAKYIAEKDNFNNHFTCIHLCSSLLDNLV